MRPLTPYGWRIAVCRSTVYRCSYGTGPLESCGKRCAELEPTDELARLHCSECGEDVRFVRRPNPLRDLQGPFCVDEVVIARRDEWIELDLWYRAVRREEYTTDAP